MMACNVAVLLPGVLQVGNILSPYQSFATSIQLAAEGKALEYVCFQRSR